MDWVSVSGQVDVDRLDAFLEGWDPDAEQRAAEVMERKLHALIG